MRMMRLSGRPAILRPQHGGVVVLGIDGDQQPVLGEAELLGHQVPGELDRAILEIIAEREIAEHLEEGVMPRGVADILEVVVLAAGAHAFLRRGGARIGALLGAGEDVLELHHAGIGEQQRRVVARHQRARRHDLVAVALRNSRGRRRECRWWSAWRLSGSFPGRSQDGCTEAAPRCPAAERRGIGFVS